MIMVEHPAIRKIETNGYLKDTETMGYCEKCKSEITGGYDYYEYEGKILCEDCFDNELWKLRQECLIEK